MKYEAIWKDYFENLYNIDTQEKVAVHMCGFDGIQRGNYFIGEPIKITEQEVRMEKMQSQGEMVKGGGDMMVDWI